MKKQKIILSAEVLASYAQTCKTKNTLTKEEIRNFQHSWPTVHDYIVCGLSDGQYGFTQNPDELRRIASLGCEEAQNTVAYGVATGDCGFLQRRC